MVAMPPAMNSGAAALPVTPPAIVMPASALPLAAGSGGARAAGSGGAPAAVGAVAGMGPGMVAAAGKPATAGAAAPAAAAGKCPGAEMCQVSTIGGFKFCSPMMQSLPPNCMAANQPCGSDGKGTCFDAASVGFAGMLFCLYLSCS
jgi:hypothetical protein